MSMKKKAKPRKPKHIPLLTIVDPRRVAAKALLDWIEGSLRQQLNDRQLKRCTAEALMTEVYSKGRQAGRRYREIEFFERLGKMRYLLVDDIQDVGADDDDQNEFYLPLSQIVINNGCNVVFTSDRPITDLALVNPDHRQLLEWGKIVHVGPPPRS